MSSLSSTRSLLLMIDEMYTLAVVDCDCRSFALRPCLLRANVIKWPITNASLQASAAAGCSVGAALAGVSTYQGCNECECAFECRTYSGFSDDWQTQRCFLAPSWMSSCRRNSAAIFSPSRCSIDAISSANCVYNHCL